MQTAKECYFDHLVIGSGLAGLSTALMLAEHHAGSIGIITKSSIDDCNSKMAQGGIACVTDVEAPSTTATRRWRRAASPA